MTVRQDGGWISLDVQFFTKLDAVDEELAKEEILALVDYVNHLIELTQAYTTFDAGVIKKVGDE